MPIPVVLVVDPTGIKVRYQVADPTGVQAVTALRLFTSSTRTGTPAYAVGPAVLMPGTTDVWEFTLPSTLAPALYYLIVSVTYTDGSTADDRDDVLLFPYVDSGLVTIADYQRITGDRTTAPDILASQLLAAQDLVEDHLRRPLALGTRIERLRLYSAEAIDGGYDGAYLVYPHATPILSAVGLTVVSPVSAAGAFPDGGPFLRGIVGQGVQPFATVTYTGGWTSQTLPEAIRVEIARIARGSLTPSPVPAGATAVRVGDVSVTYANAAAAGSAVPASSQAALRRYVRRRGA